MLVRSARHIMDENCSASALQKTILPTLKGIFDVAFSCKHCFVYEQGSPKDKLITVTLQRPQCGEVPVQSHVA